MKLCNTENCNNSDNKSDKSNTKNIENKGNMINYNEPVVINNSELENKIKQLENKINQISNLIIHNSGTNVDNIPEKSNNIRKNVTKSEQKAQTNIVKNFVPVGKKAEGWGKLVNGLKESGKIMLYTNLVNTTATEVNDMTIGIVFQNGITPFGKSILDKPESINELTKLVSLEYGKPMQVKYIDAKHPEETNDRVSEITKEIGMPINIIDE